MDASDRKSEMANIQAMFQKAKEHGDDKVSIAIQTYELVDKHIRKLDSDLAKFEAEMKEKGRLSQTETETEDEQQQVEDLSKKNKNKTKNKKANSKETQKNKNGKTKEETDKKGKKKKKGVATSKGKNMNRSCYAYLSKIRLLFSRYEPEFYTGRIVSNLVGRIRPHLLKSKIVFDH